MPKNNGEACVQADECLSAQCVDGVCCNTGCNEPCTACNLTGTLGTCQIVPADSPVASPARPVCDTADAACSGRCDGTSSSCQFPSSSTSCVDPSCPTNATVQYGYCDGAGICVLGTYSCTTGNPECTVSCHEKVGCVFDNEGDPCEGGKLTCLNGSQVGQTTCQQGGCIAGVVEDCSTSCQAETDTTDAFCLECYFASDCEKGQFCIDSACKDDKTSCADITHVKHLDDSITQCETHTHCVAGSCVSDSSCSSDSECISGACVQGYCALVADWSSIKDVPLDKTCGCRIPGGSSQNQSNGFGGTDILVGTLALLVMGLSRRKKIKIPIVLQHVLKLCGFALLFVLVSGCCAPQQDIDADQACKDVPIALSSRTMQCTSDLDRSVNMGNHFDGKFNCTANDVNLTAKYYQCPVFLNKLPCDAIEEYGEDYEKYLGMNLACRLLFINKDGSTIAVTDSQNGQAGSSNSAGSSGSGSGGSTGGQGGAGSSGSSGTGGSSVGGSTGGQP